MEQQPKNLFRTRKIFTIFTKANNWEVRRRLSDFQWLNERLSSEFKGLKLPNFRGNQKVDIESYLNYLLSIKLLLKSRFLVFFLSCTNLKKFYSRREDEYKTSVFKSLKNTITSVMSTSFSKKIPIRKKSKLTFIILI